MSSVEFWAASSYSKIAWKALSAWHDTCQRRQRARQGQQKILQQRWERFQVDRWKLGRVSIPVGNLDFMNQIDYQLYDVYCFFFFFLNLVLTYMNLLACKGVRKDCV